MPKILYAYVDESGQETAGRFFVVGIVVTTQKQQVTTQLEKVEMYSKKRNVKWSKAHWRYRHNYIEAITNLTTLKGAIFYEAFKNDTDYRQMTAQAIVNAAKRRKGYDTLSVYVDGLRKNEINGMKRYLKPSLKPKRLIMHGVRRDENNALIRLADAICGLARDVDDGDKWSSKALKKLKKNEIIQ